MLLPEFVTSSLNVSISKTIKSAFEAGDRKMDKIISNHGFSLRDAMKSLQDIRPSGKISWSEYRDIKAVQKAADAFVKFYK